MCYSPQIKGDLIKRLYQLKQILKKPITKLANEAITEYLERKENEVNQRRLVG